MDFWIKIGLDFILRIWLLILSSFALISHWLPNNHFTECFLWLYMCHSRQTEWRTVLGNQGSQQNPSVVIAGLDHKHLPLQIWSIECGEDKLFFFFFFLFFLTKCPSAALQAELWTPVGWLRLEGANDSYMIAFCLFCCLVQKDHSRGAVLKDPHLKIAFFGTQSKKRTTHMTKCTDFFMFYAGF